jgi:DNA polymerase-1
VFIVSSDQDFVQLVNNKVVLYRPIEKEYYTPQTVFDKYKVKVENFILYKTLLGDNSDKVPGIKGLGEKGILKRFPELQTQILTLDDIFDISAVKFKENIIYSRIINEQKRLETSFKIMNLSKPMVDNNDIAYISEVVKSNFPELNSSLFKMLYDEDKLGGIIRNVDIYLKDNFFHFKGYKK